MVSGLFSPGRGSTGLGPTRKLVTRKEGTSTGTQKLRVHTPLYHRYKKLLKTISYKWKKIWVSGQVEILLGTGVCDHTEQNTRVT